MVTIVRVRRDREDLPVTQPSPLADQSGEKHATREPAKLPPEIVNAVRPLRRAYRVFAALFVMNVLLGAVIQLAVARINRPRGGRDLRPALPNYRDHARADAIFTELNDSWHYRRVVIEGWRRRPYAGRYVHIDARGRRFIRRSRNAPGRTVHFFGGSTMWGTGVDDAGTIRRSSRRDERVGSLGTKANRDG